MVSNKLKIFESRRSNVPQGISGQSFINTKLSFQKIYKYKKHHTELSVYYSVYLCI